MTGLHSATLSFLPSHSPQLALGNKRHLTALQRLTASFLGILAPPAAAGTAIHVAAADEVLRPSDLLLRIGADSLNLFRLKVCEWVAS